MREERLRNVATLCHRASASMERAASFLILAQVNVESMQRHLWIGLQFEVQACPKRFMFLAC